MFLKSFEVRWNDLDANRHLANSAYITYMSHTRMAYFHEIGLGQDVLANHEVGPVTFYEQMYYLKEVLPGMPVRVSLEVMGSSEDGMFFEFHHHFFDGEGKQVAFCEMMGGWINLKTRKLTPLDTELQGKFSELPKGEGFRTLSRADTRRYPIPRKDLA